TPAGVKNIANNLRVTAAGAGKVSLPLYFPTQDLPLGGPGGNVFQVSINSLQGLLAKAKGAVTIVTPDFRNVFSQGNGIALLNNPAVLLGGLDTLLGTLQDGLNSQVLSQSLPLIGSHLKDGAQFIQDFRGGVLDDLRTRIGNDQVTDLIRQGLFNVLGPNG